MVFHKRHGEVGDDTEFALRGWRQGCFRVKLPTEDAASLGGESEEPYIQPLLLRMGQEERVIPKGLKGEWFLGWMKNVVCHISQ